MGMSIKPEKLLAHRGLWQEKSKQNTLESFTAALNLGFGIETDVRDSDGRLTISHDPSSIDALGYDEFINTVNDPECGMAKDSLLAINVKSDGLLDLINIEAAPSIEHFFFDMSIPQMFQYASREKPLAARWSEFEIPESLQPNLVFNHVWVDAFISEWFLDGENRILDLNPGLKYVFVSPELHGRDPRKLWTWFECLSQDNENAYLCTDFPKRLAGIE